MPPDYGGICMGVDQRNHRFAPGLTPGWCGVGGRRRSGSGKPPSTSPPLSRTCSPFSLSLTHTLAHTFTHSRTLSHTLSLSHTHTLTHAHTRSLSHTHALSLTHSCRREAEEREWKTAKHEADSRIRFDPAPLSLIPNPFTPEFDGGRLAPPAPNREAGGRLAHPV